MGAHSPDDALRRILETGRRRAVSTDPEHALLWDALTRATEGGKRFRPVLLVAVHESLGGRLFGPAAEVAAAVELLHTALVIHDDVIDGDDVRRGRLNVSGTFRARGADRAATDELAEAYGRTAGILAGDLALASALRAVATCDAPSEVVGQLLDLFDSALHTSAAGELADVRFALGAGPRVSVDESLAMEQQKTSAYSFVLPLQAGAVLAGAEGETVALLGEAGRLLGIAFQLNDDLLGVFGDPAQTGKSVTSDLRTGRQTPLLTHAQGTSHWARIHPLVGRELAEGELAEVRRLLTECGSRGHVEELMATHAARARGILAPLGLPADLMKLTELGAQRDTTVAAA